MAFRLVHAQYDRESRRAYVELRDDDSDGGEVIVVAIFFIAAAASSPSGRWSKMWRQRRGT
jgi:hypothetical protein